MFWIKWILRFLVLALLGAFFHYTLPQRDIVRITSTEVSRINPGTLASFFYARQDSGNTELSTRDLRLIYAVYENGKVIVYRNEDTGWFRWPPYFKTNSSNISAEAENLKSDTNAPKWVVIKHYGWRFTPLSIYPNAVKIKEVSGPDVRLIPWFNIVFFTFLSLLVLGIYRLIQRFRKRRIDPILEDMGETWDDLGNSTASLGDRIRAWFKGLGGR